MDFTRKRIMALAAAGACVAAVTTLVQAQGTSPGVVRPTPEQEKAARAKLDKELSITPAQRTKLNAIEAKYKPQMESYQQQLFKIQQQMRAVAEQGHKETLAVLTPSQREKLQKMQNAELERLKKMYGNKAR